MNNLSAYRVLAGVGVVLAVVLGGCGDDDDEPPALSGPLAEALHEIGGGGDGAFGVGWADPQLAKEDGLGPEVMATALAPNAGSVIDQAAGLRRQFGLNPLDAERLVSVGGSYAFGLRLEGVDGRRLARALVADGGRAREEDGLEVIDIGDYAVVPEALLGLDVRGLGAFDALGRDLAVLAISDRARSALLGHGEPLLDEPVYRAASACLGDVVAARTIPDKLLLGSELGVEQVAIGVKSGGEVLCTLGGTADRADDVAASLETLVDPEARDPVSSEPIADSLRDVEVSRSSLEGLEVVKAEARVAAGEQPGFFFDTVASASLVSLLNGDPESFFPGS